MNSAGQEYELNWTEVHCTIEERVEGGRDEAHNVGAFNTITTYSASIFISVRCCHARLLGMGSCGFKVRRAK